MKRFVAALFIALAYADGHEGEEEGDSEEAQDQLADAWEATSDWFSSKQEPVSWSSIVTPSPCLLSGEYGWFKKVGINSVFIRETVSGCQMAEDNVALTWAQIENPDEAGESEAFYCTVIYKEDKPAAMQGDIYSKTLDGTGIDFDALKNVAPDEWCADEAADGCKRHQVDQWARVLTEPQTNFPYTSEGDKQSTSCTVFRTSSSPNAAFDIKNGMAYKVGTGYMLYTDMTAMKAGDPEGLMASDTGAITEMTFEAAATLLAGAAAAVVATVF